MGLHEQNRALVIDPKVLFYTQNDILGHLAWNFKTATISHSVTPSGFKFYFKTTSSGNLTDLLLASLQDFDPTWIIYELEGQDITVTGGTCATLQ